MPAVTQIINAFYKQPTSRLLLSLPISVLVCLFACVFTSAGVQAAEDTSVKGNNISLPAGPGSLEGLGKAFEPSLNTGGASYAVSIAVPAGPGGMQPSLSLNYSSGKGAGIAGLGWQVNLPALERSLENGQPEYASTDVLTYIGDTLVPLTDGSWAPSKQSQFIRFYPTHLGFIAKDKAGNVFEFGAVNEALGTQVENVSVGPNTHTFNGIYKWFLTRHTNAKGLSVNYEYAVPFETDNDSALEAGASSVNVLAIKKITYGLNDIAQNSIDFIYENRPDGFNSYQTGFKQHTQHRLKTINVNHGARQLWHYELAYEYALGDALYPQKHQNALNAGISLLKKVTRFNGDSTVSLPPMRFDYSEIYAQDMDLEPLGNFPGDEDIDRNHNGILDSDALVEIQNLPTGINIMGQEASFTDLTHDGLPDWLFYKSGQYQWAKNLGPDAQGMPQFAEAQVLNNAPVAPLSDPSVDLTDMDGDGQADFLHRINDTTWRYYRNRGNGDFAQAVAYPTTPTLRPGTSGVAYMDINLDQRLDIISAENQYLRYCQNGESNPVAKLSQGYDKDLAPFDNFPGPEDIDHNGNKIIDIPAWQCSGSIVSPLPAGINLTNPQVQLTDINGDRLKDFARVRSYNSKIEVSYWLHKGKLSFEEQVVMGNSPDATGLIVEKLKLQDINGDGLADLVYVQPGQVRFWLQQLSLTGPAFSNEQFLSAPNYEQDATALFQADLNGNGTNDFIWVSANGTITPEFLDISGDTKANLMTVIDNGMGLRTQLTFTSMGAMQANATQAGYPWNTSSPVAQQIVSKRTHILPLSTHGDRAGNGQTDRIEQTYDYRDAYYDAYKKQFRGFAFAQVETLGDSATGTQISRHFFHTGAPDGQDNDGDGNIDERELDGTTEEAPLIGSTQWVELTSKDVALIPGQQSAPEKLVQTKISQWHLRRLHTLNTGVGNAFSMSGKEVSFVGKQKDQVLFSEFSSSPKQSIKEYQYDDWGNAVSTIDYGLLDEVGDESFTKIEIAYAENGFFQMPSQSSVYAGTDASGEMLGGQKTFYDNLPLGQLTRGLATQSQNWKEKQTWLTTQSSSYDSIGNPILLIDGEGRRRQLVWDQHFRTYPVEEWIYANGVDNTPLRIQAIYDTGLGVLQQHIGFNGETTTLNYDDFGRLLSIQKPYENTPSTQYSYHFVDPFRQLEYQFSFEGSSLTSNALDKTSFVQTQLLRDDGQIEEARAHIDGLGRELATITKDELGYIVSESKWYDHQGRAIKTFRPWRSTGQAFVLPSIDTPATDITLDAQGRPLIEILPEDNLGNRSTVSFEYLPRKVEITDPAGFKTQKLFNSQDKVLRLSQQMNLGGSAGEHSESSTGLVWQHSNFNYDPLGRLTKITDAQNNMKQQKFNGLGHKTWQSDLDQGISLYEYDNSGKLSLKTDQLGRKLHYQYDGAGRLSRVLNNSYTPLYQYHYDAPQYSGKVSGGYKGKLAWVEEFNASDVNNGVPHSEHYHYDLRGNLIHKQRTLFNVPYKFHYQYDGQDRLSRQVFPDGDSLDYQYNLRGQLKRVDGVVDNLLYDETAQLRNIEYSNGTSQSRDYDHKGQLTDLQSANASESLALLSYQYDSRGNIERIDDVLQSSLNQVFKYDAISQLKTATGSFGQLRYQYDAIGNITGKFHDAPQDAFANHDVQNLHYDGGTSNRLNKGGKTGPHAVTRSSNTDSNAEESAGYEWHYNGVGQREKTIYPDGSYSLLSWDQLGRLIKWQKYAKDIEVADAENTQGELLGYEQYQYDFKGRRIYKFSSGQDQGAANINYYVDKQFEVRDDTTQKHVMAGNIRLGRLETPIAQALPQIKAYSLNPGWNQIFLTIKPDGISLLEQLGTAKDNTKTLINFNANKQQYLAFNESELGLEYKTLNQLNARDVLWLKAGQQQTWQVSGSNEPQDTMAQTLYPGWNQVQLPISQINGGESSLKQYALKNKLNKIWAYDAANNKWAYFARMDVGSRATQEHVADQSTSEQTSELANTLTSIQPNQIYWVHSSRYQIIAQANGITSTKYFLHNNHLGSVVLTTDVNGTVKLGSQYLPYGAPANAQDSKLQPYGFSAKERDASELMYFEARYYDPLSARFISPDPLYAEQMERCIESISQCNLYQYTSNNPLNYVDLWGMGNSRIDRGLATLNGYSVGIVTSLISGVGWIGGNAQTHQGLFTEFGSSAYPDDAELAGDFQAGHNVGFVVGVIGLFSSVKAKKGGCCCFVEGTLVKTVDGKIAIEKIQSGELVWSRNTKTGLTELKPVQDTFVTEGKPIYRITLLDESGAEEMIEVTDNHPFWVKGRGWVNTIDLEAGMEVEQFDKTTITVEEVEFIGTTPSTYNLTVEEFHSYFAGEQEALVHNCGCTKNKKTSSFSDNRGDALAALKKDAGIPRSQVAKMSTVKLKDGSNGYVRNANGSIVKVRQYTHTTTSGIKVIIQEHSLGHTKATTGHGAEPHFNVRPIDKPDTGNVKGTHGHYNFKSKE